MNNNFMIDERMKKLLEELKTLPNEKARIQRLKIAKAESEAETPFIMREMEQYAIIDSYYTRLCKLIKERETLFDLEKEIEFTSKNLTKHRDLTLDRATLFLNYLFTVAKANSTNTEKARVISFLTQFDEERIRQVLSGIKSQKKAYSNFLAFESDMKIVRNLFEKIGLTEIVKQIDKDLSTAESETEKDL
jgi:hypothetical protein